MVRKKTTSNIQLVWCVVWKLGVWGGGGGIFVWKLGLAAKLGMKSNFPPFFFFFYYIQAKPLRFEPQERQSRTTNASLCLYGDFYC